VSYRRDALVLAVSVFLASPGLAIVAPLMAPIRDEFGVGNFEAGLVVSAFGVARMLVDLPAGLLADRLPKALLTVGGFGFLLAGSFLSALAPSLPALLAGRALTGVGSGLVMTTAITWAGAIAPPGRQARLISQVEATWMTSATLAPVIGGAIASRWDWRATFWYCTIAAMVSAAMLLALAGRGRAAAPAACKTAAGPRALRASGPVLGAYAAGFTIFFNRNGVRNMLLPLFAATVAGLGAASVGLVVAVVAGVTVATTVLGGRLADRFGRRPVLLAGLAILLVSDLALIAARSEALLLAMGVLVGLGGISTSIPAAVIVGSVPAERLGSAIGGYRLVQDVGFVLGPLVIGAILDRVGFEAGLVLAAAAVAVGLVFVAALVRPAAAPEMAQGGV
jgi:predicted MFS family arabinose efflux permease